MHIPQRESREIAESLLELLAAAAAAAARNCVASRVRARRSYRSPPTPPSLARSNPPPPVPVPVGERRRFANYRVIARPTAVPACGAARRFQRWKAATRAGGLPFRRRFS